MDSLSKFSEGPGDSEGLEDSPGSETYSEIVKTGSDKIALPCSRAGQTRGTLVRVMRKTIVDHHGLPCIVMPGDLVRICAFSLCGDLIDVFHLATKSYLGFSRTCLLPYGTREICSCPDHKCPCVYVNFEKSLAFYQSLKKLEAQDKKLKTCDPGTPEGQCVGALLEVKHKPRGTSKLKDCNFKVGDIIKYLEPRFNSHHVIKAENLRTGKVGEILWGAVFPVGMRQACDCEEKSYKCSCIYMNFAKSMAYIAENPYPPRVDNPNHGNQFDASPSHNKNSVGTDELHRLQSNKSSRSGRGSFGPSSMAFHRRGSGRKMGGGSLRDTVDNSGASSRTGTPPQQVQQSATSSNAFQLLAELSLNGS